MFASEVVSARKLFLEAKAKVKAKGKPKSKVKAKAKPINTVDLTSPLSDVTPYVTCPTVPTRAHACPDVSMRAHACPDVPTVDLTRTYPAPVTAPASFCGDSDTLCPCVPNLSHTPTCSNVLP